jgi:anti-sigma B factor antagonist
MGMTADQFRITDAEISGLVGVAVAGEIDGATRDLLEAALDKAAGGNGGGPVLLDLGACTFVDSTGLHAIVKAATRLQARGRRLAVSNLRGNVREVFRLSGLDSWDGLLVADGRGAER